MAKPSTVALGLVQTGHRKQPALSERLNSRVLQTIRDVAKKAIEEDDEDDSCESAIFGEDERRKKMKR